MLVDIHTHHVHSKAACSIYNVRLQKSLCEIPATVRYFSMGIHPWDSHLLTVDDLNQFSQHYNNPSCIALGECGLDNHSEAHFEQQKKLFEAQISISEQLKKPLIVHCVGYFNELLQIKKYLNPRQAWIIHGFRAKPQLAHQLLNAGCALSYGEHFNTESVSITPTQSLFVESDESTLSIEQLYSQLAASKRCEIAALIAGEQLLQQQHLANG